MASSYDDGVVYTLASATALPYADNTFDTIILFDVLEHIPGAGPFESLTEIQRVLKPGGVFHALIPCEGQPGTLFWLLWKLKLGGDLKVRHGDHIQRFERSSFIRQIEEAGFSIKRVRYSMHYFGQVKDVLTYVAREPWFKREKLDNVFFKAIMHLLWVIGYAEARFLDTVDNGAAVIHVDAVRR